MGERDDIGEMVSDNIVNNFLSATDKEEEGKSTRKEGAGITGGQQEVSSWKWQKGRGGTREQSGQKV